MHHPKYPSTFIQLALRVSIIDWGRRNLLAELFGVVLMINSCSYSNFAIAAKKGCNQVLMLFCLQVPS